MVSLLWEPAFLGPLGFIGLGGAMAVVAALFGRHRAANKSLDGVIVLTLVFGVWMGIAVISAYWNGTSTAVELHRALSHG